jgi:hypothetical protein
MPDRVHALSASDFAEAVKAWRGRKGKHAAADGGQWETIAALAARIGCAASPKTLANHWSSWPEG